MGADIRLESRFRKNHTKYSTLFEEAVKERNKLSQGMEDTKDYKRIQKNIDKYFNLMYSKGYFRDSYNASSLVQQLGLSWWDWCDRFANEDGNVFPDNLRTILKELEENKHKLEDIKGRTIPLFNESVEDDYKYFKNKYDKLTKLINQAIKLDEPLDFNC